MRQSFRHLEPDRIQIRQGGGVLAIFGLPFFAAGVFMLLTTLSVIKMSNADECRCPDNSGCCSWASCSRPSEARFRSVADGRRSTARVAR
jgi:hypothetical protein